MDNEQYSVITNQAIQQALSSVKTKICTYLQKRNALAQPFYIITFKLDKTRVITALKSVFFRKALLFCSFHSVLLLQVNSRALNGFKPVDDKSLSLSYLMTSQNRSLIGFRLTPEIICTLKKHFYHRSPAVPSCPTDRSLASNYTLTIYQWLEVVSNY